MKGAARAVISCLILSVSVYTRDDAAAQSTELLWEPGQGPAAGAPCTSVSGMRSPVTEIQPGEYSLTLVIGSGRPVGEPTTGRMILRSTSPEDRSPRTGERAVPPMGAETPLYGAAVLDWKAATAPVSLSEPVPPNSLDPVYPGVLVWLDSRRTLILIGTLSNIRNGNTWEDGAGIALDVIDQSAGRLRGDWNRWGIIGFSSGGSGYFCLDPV